MSNGYGTDISLEFFANVNNKDIKDVTGGKH
jgi:hypothetical protein